MKKITLFVLAIFLSANSFAQIGVREKPTNAIAKPIQYDSLQLDFVSYSKEELYKYKKYVGQKLFYPKLTDEDKKRYNFSELYVDKETQREITSTSYESTAVGQVHLLAIDNARTKNDKEIATNAFNASKSNYLKSKRYKTDLYQPFIANETDIKSGKHKEPLIYNSLQSIEGKTFTIIDVFSGSYKEPKPFEPNITPDTYQLCFQLLDEDNNTLYWQVFPRYIKDKFIIQGYYDRQRERFVGHTYVYRDQILSEYFNKGDRMELNDYAKIVKSHKITLTSESQKFADINTQEPVEMARLSEWKCIDISLMEGVRKFELFYIMSNGNSNEIKVPVGRMAQSGFISKNSYIAECEYLKLQESERIALEQKAKIEREEYIAKRKSYLVKTFGEANGMKIYYNQVELGMTKEMCREAWGEKSGIVTNSNIEIWTYGLSSLTFEGDKLIQIVAL